MNTINVVVRRCLLAVLLNILQPPPTPPPPLPSHLQRRLAETESNRCESYRRDHHHAPAKAHQSQSRSATLFCPPHAPLENRLGFAWSSLTALSVGLQKKSPAPNSNRNQQYLAWKLLATKASVMRRPRMIKSHNGRTNVGKGGPGGGESTTTLSSVGRD